MNMARLQWFEAYGVELEYALVDAESLNVRPLADRLLATLAGVNTSDFVDGATTWSNELTNHVLELKTTAPVAHLTDAMQHFRTSLANIQPSLLASNLRLLPGGMHPWMDPRTETQLWPGEGAAIYETYHQIFNCHRHGWANVQSVHLNLPFADDDQFGRLHAAVRVILPLLPALAASSPVTDGRRCETLDTRISHYISHCDRVPQMMGDVVPEPVFDEAGYRRTILDPIETAIRPLDPEGVMEVAFLNARGAIARFDRGSIEIRLMDVQEFPGADLAICAAVVAVVKALASERWSSQTSQRAFPTPRLRTLLEATSRDADETWIADPTYLALFGIRAPEIQAASLWRMLVDQLRPQDDDLATMAGSLQVILDQGPLARRIRRSLGDSCTRLELAAVYRKLCDCLQVGAPYLP